MFSSGTEELLKPLFIAQIHPAVVGSGVIVVAAAKRSFVSLGADRDLSRSPFDVVVHDDHVSIRYILPRERERAP